MTLNGRTALVTGGARRVGREIAIELARAGADIVVHFHTSETEARVTAAEIEALGRRCVVERADLSNAEDVGALVDRLGRAVSQVDILVNNASVYFATPLGGVTADDWDGIMAVNLRAPFLLSRALGLGMRERGWGRIVNIADCAIRRPYREYLPYLVSKAGLEALTRVLAVELAPEVLVNTVSPGIVLPPEDSANDYDARMRRTTLLQQLGEPEDVARAVRFLVAESPFTTGAEIRVDGGAGMR